MSSSTIAGTAREHILSDHDHLRGLLKQLAESTLDALRDERRRPRVRDSLAELRDELERHLAYEEATLIPLLANADAWGPARVDNLVKDHSGQRALLVALTEDAGDGVRTIEALVDEISWFVRSLEHDMVDEEATFLNAEVLGDAFFVQGQADR
jgi:iron-sulfur cluster repair protein YtfE (RIC family)